MTSPASTAAAELSRERDALARLLDLGVAALSEAGGNVDVPAAPSGAPAPGEPQSLIDLDALVPLLLAGRHREVERLLEERLGR